MSTTSYIRKHNFYYVLECSVTIGNKELKHDYYSYCNKLSEALRMAQRDCILSMYDGFEMRVKTIIFE